MYHVIKKGAYMNHCDYQIIEISPKDLIIEPGFNPREAVIGDLCYEQEPVKSAIISLKQAYKSYIHKWLHEVYRNRYPIVSIEANKNGTRDSA